MTETDSLFDARSTAEQRAYLVLAEESVREAEARFTELTTPPWVLPVVADVARARNDLRALLNRIENIRGGATPASVVTRKPGAPPLDASNRGPYLLPLRVRIAKRLLPPKYGVVREEGWEDRRV